MKFKDLIPLIPTVEIARIYKKSGTDIIFEETVRRYVDMDLYGERTVCEIIIAGTASLMIILED